MMSTKTAPVLALLLVVGCRTEQAPLAPAPPSSSAAASTAPVADAAPSTCRDDLLAFGGRFLVRPDGTKLWYDVAGPADAPAVLFLHGGPGYNAHSFRRAVGAELEAHLRMVYVDQRGAGRSHQLGAKAALGLAPTLDDLEALRGHLGVEAWHVMGHSYGGVVAVQYKAAFPRHVDRLILVDTAANLELALGHQVTTLAQSARAQGWDDAKLAALAADARPAMARLADAYSLIGRLPVQARLHYATPAAQDRMEAWDAESRLLPCTRGALVAAYTDEGGLSAAPRNVRVALDAAIEFRGARSEVIGAPAHEDNAAVWGAPVVTFPGAGHFVYLEAPDKFVAETRAFLSRALEPDCTLDHFVLPPTLGNNPGPHTWSRRGREITETVTLPDGRQVTRTRGGCVHLHDAIEIRAPGHKACPATRLDEAQGALDALTGLRERSEDGTDKPLAIEANLRAAVAAKTVQEDATFPCGDATCTASCEQAAGGPATFAIHYDFAL